MGYAILLQMNSHYKSQWLERIQHGNFSPIILAILDGVGPLKSVLAQGMLAFSPFLGSSVKNSWVALAEMMEDPSTSRVLSDDLHQEGS